MGQAVISIYRKLLFSYNAGGLQSPYTPGGHRDPFFASLRSDQKRTSLDPNDHLMRANIRWCSPQAKNTMRKTRLQVMNVTQRLFSTDNKKSPSAQDYSKKWATDSSKRAFARTSFN